MKPSSTVAPKAQETVASTKVFVTRTVGDNRTGEVQTAAELPKAIEIHRFVTEPAGVYVQDEIKFSKNFKSAGYTIGVYRPCYVEEIDTAKEWANNFVHTALAEQTPDLVALVDKLGGM